MIDGLHFLDCTQREGRASNDHIKYLANHTACTVVRTGVDLEQSPLLSEGRGVDRNTQTAGRFSHRHLRAFGLANKSQAESGSVSSPPWRRHSLYHHEPGSLARHHWRYLHERTAGSIAALHDLIRLAAIRAVHRQNEAVTQDLLDSITSSYAAERQYAKITARRKQRRASQSPATGPTKQARGA